MEFDYNTPWYDLATVHFAVTMIIGVVCGYTLKYAIDEMLTRLANRRECAAEELEDLLEQLAAQRAAEATHLQEVPALQNNLPEFNKEEKNTHPSFSFPKTDDFGSLPNTVAAGS